MQGMNNQSLKILTCKEKPPLPLIRHITISNAPGNNTHRCHGFYLASPWSFSATSEYPTFQLNSVFTMIFFVEKRSSGWNEHLHQVGHFADDTESTKDGLQTYKIQEI